MLCHECGSPATHFCGCCSSYLCAKCAAKKEQGKDKPRHAFPREIAA